jgi:hypothetical protein
VKAKLNIEFGEWKSEIGKWLESRERFVLRRFVFWFRLLLRSFASLRMTIVVELATSGCFVAVIG